MKTPLGIGNLQLNGKIGAALALSCCMAIAVAMALCRPFANGYNYHLSVIMSLELSVIWYTTQVKPAWLLRRAAPAVILLLGLLVAAAGFATFNPDREVIHTYRSVFAAIDIGQNPYTCGTIVHFVRVAGREKTIPGNFNYPPMELYPYDLAQRIAGGWNATVLLIAMLLIHALCCLILLCTFPEAPWTHLWPFFPLLILAEFQTTVSMTLLIVALLLWAIRRHYERPRWQIRLLIAVLFGIGLACKFLVIPLMAAYYWNRFDSRRLRSLAEIARDAAIALATAVLIMARFGVREVLKSTILFNLILHDRALQTTFFPNVLSGPCQWLHAGALYPFAALGILALTVLLAPRLSLLPAMMTAAYAFLFVAPTPEPQFFPVIIYLGLSAALWTMSGSKRNLVMPWIVKVNENAG